MALYRPVNVNFPSVMSSMQQWYIFCLEDAQLSTPIYVKNIYGHLWVKRKIKIGVTYHERRVKEAKTLLKTVALGKIRKVTNLKN